MKPSQLTVADVTAMYSDPRTTAGKKRRFLDACCRERNKAIVAGDELRKRKLDLLLAAIDPFTKRRRGWVTSPQTGER